MPAKEKEIARIVFELQGIKRRFVNIVSLKNQYKITFDGFRQNKPYAISSNAMLGSVGLVSMGKISNTHQGEISVGYHEDGNVMFKFGSKNQIWAKKYPFKNIPNGKSSRFLTIGLMFDHLKIYEKTKAEPINFQGRLDTNDFIQCDFYLCNKHTTVKGTDKHVNDEMLFFEDPERDLNLFIHFYNVKPHHTFYIAIPNTG